MISVTYLIVHSADIDNMGIAHHSRYPAWFESGRNDFFDKAGIPNSRIAAFGLSLPLSKLKCEYKSPARYHDKIMVITRLKEVSYVKMKFDYALINTKNGKVIATGETVHAWTNADIEPLNIKKEAPEIYELLQYIVEKEEQA